MSECSRIIIGLCLLGGGPVRAADLDQALAAAASAGPDVLIARVEAEQGRAAVGAARAALLPRVTATAGYTWNQFPAEFSLPGSTDKVVIQPQDQVEAGLRVDVPLIAPSAYLRYAAANAGSTATLARVEDREESALLDVVGAWADAAAEQGALAAANAAVGAAEAGLGRTRDRHMAGLEGLLQVRRAEAELARAREIQARALADQEAAARRLARLSGLTDPATIGAERPAPEEGDLEAIVSSHPDVEMAEAELAQARRTLAAEHASRLPTVGVFGQMRATNATGFAGEPVVGSAGAALTWGVWEGGRSVAGVRDLRSRVDQAEARLARVAQEVRDGVLDARARYLAASRSAEAAEAREVAAAEAETLVSADVEAGRSNAADLWIARRDLLDARLATARARADRAFSREQYRQAMGQSLILEAR